MSTRTTDRLTAFANREGTEIEPGRLLSGPSRAMLGTPTVVAATIIFTFLASTYTTGTGAIGGSVRSGAAPGDADLESGASIDELLAARRAR